MTNEEIIRELYHSRNISEIAEQFAAKIRKKDADIEKIIMDYMPALWLGQSFGSVATRYSAFRKELKKTQNRNAKKALKILNFPTEGFDILKRAQDEKALEKKESQVFDEKNAEDLLRFLKETIEKRSWPAPSSRQREEQIEAYWLAAYLALATGRRFTEVLKTMDISKHGTNVKITGLTKKAPGEDVLENACLLDDYKSVKKALKRLREIFDATGLTVDEVGKKNSYTFNRYLKQKILKNDEMSFHDLRTLYAELCWNRYGKESGMSKEDFIGHVLGHRKIVTATDHYLKFKS